MISDRIIEALRTVEEWRFEIAIPKPSPMPGTDVTIVTLREQTYFVLETTAARQVVARYANLSRNRRSFSVQDIGATVRRLQDHHLQIEWAAPDEEAIDVPHVPCLPL